MGRDETVKLKPKNQNFSLTPCITGLKIVLETGLKSKFRPYMAPGDQYLGHQIHYTAEMGRDEKVNLNQRTRIFR